MGLSRRRTLRVAGGVAAVAAAGCLGAADDPGGATTTGDPPNATRTATGDCTGYEPLPEVFDEVEEGTLGAFELTVEPATVAVGDAFTVRLRNRTGEEATSGNRRKFDVQRETDDGWASVYRVEEKTFWTDEAVAHAPDEGFTWELSATPDGLAPDDAAYRVCEPVELGSYRFVYWGLTPPEERETDFETDYAVAARFDVVE